MSLNINGSYDPSYRYKMPLIQSTSIKSNGGDTIINNLNEICKTINQPPLLILEYLSIYCNTKKNNKKFSITGEYTNEHLQHGLQIYINHFVICSKCGIPEIKPQLKKISKKNILLELKCSACGQLSVIESNNKNSKAYDLIIKYLEKNEWIQCSKGTMVINSLTKNTNIIESTDDDDILDPLA